MSKEVESKLAALKRQLAAGTYEVDAKQVAAAMIGRPSGLIAVLRPRALDAPGPEGRRPRLA
ncbi:MAG: flagellar biosynthesis anti-sigma factor FlgM [Solirubrobacteraceae bacterium]